MHTINNATATAIERRLASKKSGRDRGIAKSQLGPGTKAQRRLAQLLEQARQMDFSALAQMLRDSLKARSVKSEHAMSLLAVLEAKADGNEEQLKCVVAMRHDWENIGRELPATSHVDEILSQARNLDFATLARMLRDSFRSRRLTREQALSLLGLLDDKAGSDATFLRIAKNLRQDWQSVGARPLVVHPSSVETLPWVLLPAIGGRVDLQALVSHVRDFARRNPAFSVDEQRIRYACELRPAQVFVGRDHFDGYIVFTFSRSSRVLLENPIEGNAAYVFSKNWRHLSTLAKAELIGRKGTQRIVHSGAWKKALRAALAL